MKKLGLLVGLAALASISTAYAAYVFEETEGEFVEISENSNVASITVDFDVEDGYICSGNFLAEITNKGEVTIGLDDNKENYVVSSPTTGIALVGLDWNPSGNGAFSITEADGTAIEDAYFKVEIDLELEFTGDAFDDAFANLGVGNSNIYQLTENDFGYSDGIPLDLEIEEEPVDDLGCLIGFTPSSDDTKLNRVLIPAASATFSIDAYPGITDSSFDIYLVRFKINIYDGDGNLLCYSEINKQ